MLVLLKLIITLVTVIGTVILLIFNYKSNQISNQTLEEMRLNREETFRPYVYLDIVFKDYEMDLILKNDGKTPAYNVRFSLDQDLKVWTALSSEKEYKLKDMGISNEIEMLSPGEVFSEWFDTSFLFFKNNEVRHLTGILHYDNGSGKDFEFKIDLDLTPYEARTFSTEKGLKELIRALESMKMNLERKWI